MYTREIKELGGETDSALVADGKPRYGTWLGAFDRVDFLEIERPFALPVPRPLRDWRIKEWETFIIEDDSFILEAFLCNLKLYRIAQVFLFDKESGEKLRFGKIIPLSGWKLPQSLANSSIDSRSWGFFFRIHDWLDADAVKLDLDIEATGKRPSFTAHAEFDMTAGRMMTVCMPFERSRAMYVCKALTTVEGDLVFGGRHYILDPVRTSGVFADFKGFFPYRTRSVWCNGMGFDGECRRFGFSVSENQTRDAYRQNENALWVGGELVPLPPVKITMPGGRTSDWIIQDMEGMVDLVFTPREEIRSGRNLLLINSEYATCLGHYNGVLTGAGGSEIPVHNLWGTGEQLYLRM